MVLLWFMVKRQKRAFVGFTWGSACSRGSEQLGGAAGAAAVSQQAAHPAWDATRCSDRGWKDPSKRSAEKSHPVPHALPTPTIL